MERARIWGLVGAVLVVVVVLRALASFGSDDAPAAATSAASTSASPPVAAATDRIEVPAAAATPSFAVVAAASAATDLPPGVSRAQWDALSAEMRNRPDGAAELQRVAEFLAWSESLRRFRDARQAGTDPAAVAALARELDGGLDERLRQSEVTAAEALRIKGAVLEAMGTDAPQRAAAMQQWAAAELAPTAATDPRQAALAQRQGELLAAWAAAPAGSRDNAALERELEALRRQTYGQPGR